MSSLFQVSQFYKPDRSVHDIGYSWKGTPRMGVLIPFYLEEMMPGDTFDIDVFAKLRAMPMINPPFADIEITFDFWFDPYRLIWPSDENDRITGDIPQDGWMGFITRAADKGQVGGAQLADAVQWPRWNLDTDDGTGGNTLYSLRNALEANDNAEIKIQHDYFISRNEIWYSLGLPDLITWTGDKWVKQASDFFWTRYGNENIKEDFFTLANDAPRRSYYRIWNFYYRDENLEDAVDWLTDTRIGTLKPVHQDRTYFTTALPFQQRGTPPALPVSGFMPLEGYNSMSVAKLNYTSGATYPVLEFTADTNNPTNVSWTTTTVPPVTTTGELTSVSAVALDPTKEIGVSLEGAATFGATDMRFAIQVQKWLEKNARGGIRYHEFLMSHFGVRPADSSLGMPEYIGTSKQKVNISEVLQTSESAQTPQGTMAGHGISVDYNSVGKYTAPEWGIVLGLMFVKPRTEYLGQGLPRFLTRRTAWDYPFPVFQGLSEQAVYKHELYYQFDTNADETANRDWMIFGYQGRFDECRHRTGVVTGELRDIKQSWTMNNIYTSEPNLNSTFIQAYNNMRPFALKEQAPFVADVYIKNRAIRPITKYGTPGYVDHF